MGLNLDLDWAFWGGLASISLCVFLFGVMIGGFYVPLRISPSLDGITHMNVTCDLLVLDGKNYKNLTYYVETPVDSDNATNCRFVIPR